VLDRRGDPGALDERLRALVAEPCIQVFRLDDEMLDRATHLALPGIAQKPFDHAILAGILVSAERLWNECEGRLSFCEEDSDLQSWDKVGNAKPPLGAAYDRAH